MNRTALIFALVAGAVAGPPMTGAVGSLFWSSAADGNGAQRVAARLYQRTQIDPAAKVLRRLAPTSRCMDLSTPTEGRLLIDESLEHYRSRRVRSHYSNMANDALTALPRPVLGALDACVGGSPASLFCLGYVTSRVEQATDVPETIERGWVAQADREMEAARCSVNLPKGPLSSPRS